MQKTGIKNSLQALLMLALIFCGLYFAKPFLVPLTFAGLFAMLFLPITRKLEKSGVSRGLAVTASVILFLLLITVIIMIVTWQVTNLTSDLGNLEGKAHTILQQLRDFIERTFGITVEQQQEMLDSQSGNASGLIAKFGISIMDVAFNFVLVTVYIFLFLYYRRHIKKFILQVVPKQEDDNAEDAIFNIEKVSQKYLSGLGLMIICLWIMYSIGFTIVGLKNAFFFAILCGLFEIVPYVGNLTGNILAVLMALTQGGGFPMVIGILITYSLVQSLQTYLLEPLVVGPGVNINPLFTIIGLVLGELVWGIPGLVLAIPLLAIVKIICDHTPALKPYGFLIGREKPTDKRLVEKMQGWFKKKKTK
jgi:predicted PurR-regulated permease PerM